VPCRIVVDKKNSSSDYARRKRTDVVVVFFFGNNSRKIAVRHQKTRFPADRCVDDDGDAGMVVDLCTASRRGIGNRCGSSSRRS